MYRVCLTLSVFVDVRCQFFFFNDTATTEIYTLSLHDALPILLALSSAGQAQAISRLHSAPHPTVILERSEGSSRGTRVGRSEEHTSELQSRQYLVCRLLLEKKQSLRLRTTTRGRRGRLFDSCC